MNKVTEQVLEMVTTDGVVDHAALKTIWMEIGKYRQENKAAATEALKASKAATTAAQADLGLAYFGTLKEGDAIQWTANGEIQNGTVGKQKEGAKRAHLILNEIPQTKAKNPTADRYVAYDKIIVPADYTAQVVA